MLDTHFLNYFCEEDLGKGLKGAESHRSKTACPRLIMSTIFHRLKTLALVHRSHNISKCSYSSWYFLSYGSECLIQSWYQGKKSYLTDFILPRKLSNNSKWRAGIQSFRTHESFVPRLRPFVPTFRSVRTQPAGRFVPKKL